MKKARGAGGLTSRKEGNGAVVVVPEGREPYWSGRKIRNDMDIGIDGTAPERDRCEVDCG